MLPDFSWMYIYIHLEASGVEILYLDVSRTLAELYLSNVTAPRSGGRREEGHQLAKDKILSKFELPEPKGSFTDSIGGWLALSVTTTRL